MEHYGSVTRFNVLCHLPWPSSQCCALCSVCRQYSCPSGVSSLLIDQEHYCCQRKSIVHTFHVQCCRQPILLSGVVTCTRTHARTHTLTHTHTHTRTYTRTHAHTLAHTHARTHALTHTHTRARTHAHTHTHTHLCLYFAKWYIYNIYYGFILFY